METLSLKELKEQNAAIEAESEDNQGMVEQDGSDIENINDDVEVKADDSQETDTVDGSEESEELESWQQTEEQETSENDQSGFKPNAEAAKKRKQNKALRGQVKEQESEIELLKKQIEELKTGDVRPTQNNEPLLGARPTLEQFDYDSAKYESALDDWQDQKFKQMFNDLNQSTQQQQQQAAQADLIRKNLQNSLDDHYSRAEKLVESGKVDAASYQMADTNVRRALENIFPNAGDSTADQIIDTLNSLGEGSEKVMYMLGRNNNKLNELTGIIQNDPSGLKMMAHLGKLHAEVQNPSKTRSNAPKPATSLQGDSATKNGYGSLYKQYQKSNDVQTRLDLKRKARQAGEDVSKW